MTDAQHPQDDRQQSLEQQLLDGIASGPPEEVTPHYLAELFREAEAIIEASPREDCRPATP